MVSIRNWRLSVPNDSEDPFQNDTRVLRSTSGIQPTKSMRLVINYSSIFFIVRCHQLPLTKKKDELVTNHDAKKLSIPNPREMV